MSLSNKRKLTTSPVEEGDFPAKRRQRGCQSSDGVSSTSKTPVLAATLPPISHQIARPKRWRRAQQPASSEPPLCYNQPHRTPNRQTQRTPSQNVTIKRHPKASPQAGLRFSFEAAFDHESHAHRDQALNRSFSDLAVTTNMSGQTTSRTPKAEFPVDQAATGQAFRPDLSKPKKKREGYGFSYSETFWCDSDEYPDTECDWEADEESHRPVNTNSTATKQENHWNTDTPTAQVSFGGSTIVDPDCSFDDFVVVRDIGSFHMARPQKILPCTKATREDTMRLKNQAKTLFSKYEESGDVQAQLLTRLERMVLTEEQKQRTGFSAGMTSISKCALKLREFLLRIMEERIETGENRAIVEHELEWVRWLVDASQTGVLHLKTAGCKCRPDWEED